MTDVLIHALDLDPGGIALEFGVGEGSTLKLITERMPAIGFDSFTGLPEDWRDEFPAGTFACTPPVVAGAMLVLGEYGETLTRWVADWGHLDVGLVHVDCDLYSSTVTVLDALTPMLAPGCLLIFDEYHGYPEAHEHEARAWAEYTRKEAITWEVIGHGPEQILLRLT